MRARSSGLLRAGRAALVRAIRTSRFFPVTIPDRLGQDDELAGGRLDESVIVYFADTAESLYQIQMWLRPFEALHRRLPVVVVCQDSRTAARIRAASTLRVITIARYGRLDDLLSRSDVRVVLYVNQTPRNFECLRFTRPMHLYLGHGESDKGVSATNQIKAYDYHLVAGRQAIARIAAHVRRYDAATRCIPIGHPPLDGTGLLPRTAPSLDPPAVPARPRVVYAPTWEGAQPSVAYSSLVTHGTRLVGALMGAGYQVTYRPHPLTGVTSGDFGGADSAIRRMIDAAPGGGHRIDVSVPLEASLVDADVLVCDISAVALTWLATGRPLVVTRAGGAAEEARTLLTDALPRLAEADLPRVLDIVRAALEDTVGRADRIHAIGEYFAVATDGAATELFVDTVADLAAQA